MEIGEAAFKSRLHRVRAVDEYFVGAEGGPG